MPTSNAPHFLLSAKTCRAWRGQQLAFVILVTCPARRRSQQDHYIIYIAHEKLPAGCLSRKRSMQRNLAETNLPLMTSFIYLSFGQTLHAFRTCRRHHLQGAVISSSKYHQHQQEQCFRVPSALLTSEHEGEANGMVMNSYVTPSTKKPSLSAESRTVFSCGHCRDDGILRTDCRDRKEANMDDRKRR